MELFPNPAKDVIQLRVSENIRKDKVEIHVYNSLGNQLIHWTRSADAMSATESIPTRNWPRGRPVREYEPFESTATTGERVAIPSGTPFSLTAYEPSPLNRKSSTTAPEWYPMQYGYGHLSIVDTIGGVAYPAYTVRTDTLRDANGHSVIRFHDKRGRLLRTQKEGTLPGELLHTDYTYDVKDRIDTIYPPGTTTDNDFDNLIFAYRYDGRDNVAAKKVPDQEWIDYVYDERDLNTGMRDANMRQQGDWLHLQYDAYGRETSTGFIDVSGQILGATNYTYSDSLSRTWYDGDGIGVSDPIFLGKVSRERTRILGINDFLDSRTEYDLYGRIEETRTNHIGLLNDNSADRVTYDYDYADNLVSSSRDHKYPNHPTLSITNEMTWDQSGRQIDHYLNIGGQRTHISKQAYTVKDQLKEKNLGNSTFTSLQSLDYTYLANGLLRGINHVQTETNDWFKLGIHYDQPDGTTISGFTPQYNGNIGALSWQTGTGNEQVYRYAYDYLDRITSAQMTGNSYRTAYSYDQRGNLLTLDRYDANGTMIDDLSYIPYSGTNKIKNLFDGGTSAGFDEGDAPIFAAYTYGANGNLAHDPFKNLGIAYNHLNLPDTIIQPGSNNRIVYRYDAAGNKLRKEVLNDSIVLTGPFTENQYRARFITTDGQPTALDSTLLVAQDSIVFKPGFHAKSGLRLTAKIDSTLVPIDQTDYIGGIEYRNLPRGMASSPAQGADSTGRGDIQAIYHPEGRAVPSGSNWRHEYVITDHLGNTRLRFSDLDGNSQIDSTEILDETDYYPYGMEWNAGGYKYTYNGKEKNTELGLNWLDYHNRWLDPVTGRWNVPDPLAFEAPQWTPYRYGFNNPILYIDPDGLFESRKEARQYRKDHEDVRGIIKKESDGSFSIYNYKDRTATSNLGGDLGVMTAGFYGSKDWIDIQDGENGMLEIEHRDGTTSEMKPYVGGTAPVGGGGKGFKLFSSLKKAFGPFKNWIRGPKGSYSKSLGKKTQKSISWGASPAKKGKYVKQIGNPYLRRLNQWLRGKKLPPGKKSWRTSDPGHIHLDKTKPK